MVNKVNSELRSYLSSVTFGIISVLESRWQWLNKMSKVILHLLPDLISTSHFSLGAW